MQSFSGLTSLKGKACGSDHHIELASEPPRAATCLSAPSGARGLGVEVNPNSASTKDSPWLRSLSPGTWSLLLFKGRIVHNLSPLGPPGTP